MIVGKHQILFHESSQVFFSDEVWLVVIIDMTKPPELLFVLHQTHASILLSLTSSCKVIATEAEVERQFRNILPEGILSRDQRLKNIRPLEHSNKQ